jgi:putative sterol carrier protein
VYTAVTNTMKQEEYRDLPDNWANILKKMKELSEEEIKELTGAAKEAKIWCQTVLIYDLKKIQEKFKIYTLNDKNQVEINGVMYTAITWNMKQEDYRDLPDNWYNILKKMKELSEEEIKELTGAAKEARIWGQTVPLYDLKKIQEKFKVITLNDKNQVEIDWVIYTAITKRMKQEDYRDLPENWINILRKIKQLSEKEMKDLRGAGKEARIWPATAPLYNLKKIQEKFKIYTFNDKNQVEIDWVIYTAITNSMKQEEYRDLPDNWKNILRKMKDISEEEMKNLIGAWKEARIWPTTVPLYNLKKIQEMFWEE